MISSGQMKKAPERGLMVAFFVSGIAAVLLAAVITWLIPVLPFFPWFVVSWAVLFIWMRAVLAEILG
jgi:hypothetical protein